MVCSEDSEAEKGSALLKNPSILVKQGPLVVPKKAADGESRQLKP
jgi:hypothetical protein